MASEYTPNRRYPLYTDSDKPNLRDQYNGAIREIDADMADALHDSQAVADALGSGFDAQHTVRMALDEKATSTALTTEIGNREAADTALGTRIDNEVSARQTAVSNEATARANADTALGTRIDNEVSARQSADSALDGRLDTLESIIPSSSYSASSTVKQAIDGKANASSLASETTARQNADTALGNRISALEATKKVIVFGDSWATSDNNTWPNAFASQHGLTLVDHACGGAGWAQAGTDGKTILQQVNGASSDSNAKYVIVIGGVNDVRNGISYDTAKVNMLSVATNLVAKYPNAQILICPIDVPKRGSDNGSVDVCRVIFDNWYYSAFTDVALKGVATFDLLPLLQPLANVNTFAGDGLHPSGYGNSIILSALNECIFGRSPILAHMRGISAKSGFTKYGGGLVILNGICIPPSIGINTYSFTAGQEYVVAGIDGAGSNGVNLPFYQPKQIGDNFAVAMDSGGNVCGIAVLNYGSGDIKFKSNKTGSYQIYFTIPPFKVAG